VEHVPCGRHFQVWPLAGDANVALFGVFDGHGDSGHRCSQFCMRRVCELVAERKADLNAKPGEVDRRL